MISVILIASTVLFIGIIILTITYLYKRFSLSKDLPLYPVNKSKNQILTIGIIGDSWATFNKLDGILHNSLLENGIPNKITSSGQSGAKTRLIYQNLFKDNTEKNSCKFVIESNPDYCIVLGGTNDAIGQMGGNYYAYHMIKIIKTLLHYAIIPIIITLPKVGIKETHDSLNIFQRYRNLLSVIFNNKGKIENIESYRKKLLERLQIEKLKDKILLIDFDKACEGFENDSELYKNPIHLSAKGNGKLGRFIAEELIIALRLQKLPSPK